MSRVFVATETALSRPVVIKVMSSERAAGMSGERFLREIQIAAGLQHPHIVPLLTAGEAQGLPYFTMPYVRGESLRTKLAREGPLPVAEAIEILRDVASALSYAHERGVVHRDIKPDNVLLSRGHAMVTDFGVAKALSDASTAPGDTSGLTSAGVSLGTPAYMAPEQVAADPTMDHRVDLYAFGAMAYELLAGHTPFHGRSTPNVLVAHLNEPAPSIAAERPEVPPALAALIARCMEKNPAMRPQSADEILAALDPVALAAPPAHAAAPLTPSVRVAPPRRAPRRWWLVAAAVVLALGIAGAVLWRTRTSTVGPIRLAVLPFDNIGDTADAYFADGVTDAVRNKLAALPGIVVIASASSAQYRRTTKTPAQIGRELNVGYLLVGKVRWARDATGAHNRVQVSPELVDAHSAAERWGQAFDAPLTDVFQVQGEIASRVVEALGGALSSATRKELTTRPTENLAAYDAFLQGEAAAQGLSNVNAVALHRAEALYQRAVQLDPNFALAWAQLVRVEGLLYFQGSISGDPRHIAADALQHAKALAPHHAETYLASGDFAQYILQDNARALGEYTAGLALAPSSADLLRQSALAERSLGRWDAALAHFGEATALDPRSVASARRLAQTYLWLRRYPEAEAEANRALALDPANLDALETRAMVDVAQGRLAEAKALVHAPPAGVEPDEFVAFVATFWNLYWLLDEAQQRRVMQLSAAPFGGEEGVRAIVIAEVALSLGDRARSRAYGDTARRIFERMLRDRPGADADTHGNYAQALALAGRYPDAIREAERAVAMQSMDIDHYSGAYNQEVLARVELLAGDRERALDVLEPLLRAPYYLSPAWLRADPRFAALQGSDRFERLVGARSGAR